MTERRDRVDPKPFDPASTSHEEYAEQLAAREGVWWKRVLDVQRPYRWNLRRLKPGFTLDLGCGIGRNLATVEGIGVDHNPRSIEICRERNLEAFLPDEFFASPRILPGTFDSILLSHVAEHMTKGHVVGLVKPYLPYAKPDAQLIIITPQERGFRLDPTHVEFMDFEAIAVVLRELGFEPIRQVSFPFPRLAGRVFVYNEFVVVGRRLSAPR